MKPESLDDVVAKRESMSHIWKLLDVKPQYHDLYMPFLREWNRKTYRQQQQFYWFIREKKRRGEVVHENPLYALTYIKPHPYNWNGKQGINSMLKTSKMVSAYYEGAYGIYTQLEATIFEMTNQRKLN